MNFGNSFDDEKTIFVARESDAEETLFFFVDDDPENKLFLTSGEAVTVGRSIDNNFFVENKTVSRKHLTLKRNGDKVDIEIHGRNGLYMDDQIHTGHLFEIHPPVSFTIGSVACRLEFEVDEDKTIIVTSEQRSGMTNSEPPKAVPSFLESVPPEPEPEPEPVKPFDPSPRDTFIPSGSPPGPHREEPADQSDYNFQDHSPKEYTDQPAPTFDPGPVAQSDRFEPIPKDINEKQGLLNKSALKNRNIIIAGIISLSVLIVIVTVFYILPGKQEVEKTESEITSSKIVDKTPPAASENLIEDSHKEFLELANELIKSGDTVTARDVLNDIPADSPYYSRAQKILEKLPEN